MTIGQAFYKLKKRIKTILPYTWQDCKFRNTFQSHFTQWCAYEFVRHRTKSEWDLRLAHRQCRTEHLNSFPQRILYVGLLYRISILI